MLGGGREIEEGEQIGAEQACCSDEGEQQQKMTIKIQGSTCRR